MVRIKSASRRNISHAQLQSASAHAVAAAAENPVHPADVPVPVPDDTEVEDGLERIPEADCDTPLHDGILEGMRVGNHTAQFFVKSLCNKKFHTSLFCYHKTRF